MINNYDMKNYTLIIYALFLTIHFSSCFCPQPISQISTTSRRCHLIPPYFSKQRHSRGLTSFSIPTMPLYSNSWNSNNTSHKQQHPSMNSTLGYIKRQRADLLKKMMTRRKPLGRIVTFIFRLVVGYVSKWVMKVRNKTYLHDDKKNLQHFVFHRDNDVGLLTISNHCSIFDDPGIICGVLPIRKLLFNKLRSIVMDADWYYSYGWIGAAIFRGLNCLPLRRGDIRGLRNPQLAELHSRLNGFGNDSTSHSQHNSRKVNRINEQREWCHIMVEGRVLQPWRFDPLKLPRLGKFRLGAAKLIATSPPSHTVVLPYFHSGMHLIFPETPPQDIYDEKPIITNTTTTNVNPTPIITRRSGHTDSCIPNKGKRVDVYVGDPIDFSDIVPENGYSFEEDMDKQLLDQINDRLVGAMLKLEARASQDRKNRSE